MRTVTQQDALANIEEQKLKFNAIGVGKLKHGTGKWCIGTLRRASSNITDGRPLDPLRVEPVGPVVQFFARLCGEGQMVKPGPGRVKSGSVTMAKLVQIEEMAPEPHNPSRTPAKFVAREDDVGSEHIAVERHASVDICD